MIAVPTPFQVGAVNLYVLGDTLIDTGPKTREALEALKSLDLNPIRNVLITHGHVDHHGLASYIKKVSGCQIFVHEDDLSAVSDYKNYLRRNVEKYKPFLEKTGISEEFIKNFEKYYRFFETYGESCEVEPLGSTFNTDEGTLKVIHTPGHTSGSCCFLLGKTLYSGDTLLPDISTNASAHFISDDICGLESFFNSLKKITDLDIERVLPGHRSIILEYEKRIQELFKEYLERKQKVIDSLSETPQNLLCISEKVFGKVPITELLLALTECYDHLKILENEGFAEIRESEEYLFTLP